MPADLRTLHQRLGECPASARGRLRARLRGLERAKRGIDPRVLAEIERAIEAAIAHRRARAVMFPRVSYPSDLPVVARRDEIAAAIREHQVVVVCGQTGSGKSTQLPKICLELGRGVDAMIGHTQPRRIAARSIASRLAEELGTRVGRGVGAKVRFADSTDERTLIKVMTDGILLAETQRDRQLRAYDTIIIDEAHERSLNIDFLLGYLRQLLPRRPDLKLIITSATIDADLFAQHFNDAPVIEVSGRTYPVDVRYHPVADDPQGGRGVDAPINAAIVQAIEAIGRDEQGDVLVFLSGQREIREAAEALRKAGLRNTEILPLYARLSVAEQARIFKPHAGRRIVLATNVAETSLTVPGIRAVVDTGLARISRYSHRSRVQRLEVEPISRASADQRAGRCGRVGPGICVRLYGEDDYAGREAFTQPEILRSNLAGVILQMTALGLGDVERFPFVEPPDSRMIREGWRTLTELGAIDEAGGLTPIGRDLARLPVDPRIGRMVLAAADLGALAEVLIIASALSVQDPRDRPMDKRDRADAAHEAFVDEDSDFLTLINLWRAYHERARRLSHRKLRAWCTERFVSPTRMREWLDVHRQLHEMTRTMGLAINREAATSEQIHRSLLTGLLSNIGRRGEGFEYAGPHGSRFAIFPGSGQFDKKPAWVMAGELVRTTRLYARTVAPIRPEWVEQAAKHLVTRSHSDPAYNARRARVEASERVTLFGLELIAGRRVHYGPINAVESRELFIHRGLVEGAYRTRAPFAKHNATVIAQIEQLEERLRRRDLLADHKARFAFFDSRLGAEVVSGQDFERWRKIAERRDPRVLFMTEQDLLAADPGAKGEELFPKQIEAAGATLPADYRFEPGHASDGVTIEVPASVLGRLSTARADWLVPGLIEDKIIAMLKALPKAHRRAVGPAADFARALIATNPDPDTPLREAINDLLRTRTGHRIPDDAWRDDAVAEHLKLNYRVVDEAGEVVAEGRDLVELRSKAVQAQQSSGGMALDSELTRDGLTDFELDELPGRVAIVRGGAELAGYPALVDQGSAAGVRVFESTHAAARAHRAGLVRLYQLRASEDVDRAVRGMIELDEITLIASSMGQEARAMRRALQDRLVERVFLGDGPGVRTRVEFEAQLADAWDRLGPAVREVGSLAVTILRRRQELALALDRRYPPAWQPAMADLRAQVESLTRTGFLAQTPWVALRSVPRYLAGAQRRLARLGEGAIDRDTASMAIVTPYQRTADELLGAVDPGAEAFGEVDRLWWMVQELRVSLFAQDLGTAGPISPKRLDTQLARIERVRAGLETASA